MNHLFSLNKLIFYNRKWNDAEYSKVLQENLIEFLGLNIYHTDRECVWTYEQILDKTEVLWEKK